MLSFADAKIVDQDRSLPGLRTLLDADAFCESLRRLAPGREIKAAAARYVRYKPGTSCLVAYEIQTGDGVVHAYARCHAGDQLVKVTNARLRVEVTGPLGPGLLADPHAGIAVFVYPNDYEIKSLRKLFEGDRTPRRLRRILPTHTHLQHATPTVLRYKPERRFVGKLDAEGGPSAVLRLYPEAKFDEMREKAWAFKGNIEMDVPRVVGDSDRYSALAYEWVEGRPPTAIELAENGDVTESIASALAALHGQRPRLRAMYTAGDYRRGVKGACEALAALDADFGYHAAEQSSALHNLLHNRAWRAQAVHGDFTADQVVINEGRITILDFDRAGYGDPVMDLGAFSAGQIASAVTGEKTMADSLQIAAAFSAAYWRATGFADAESTKAFTACALLMLAPEPFRRRAENWPTITAGLLEAVDQVLNGETIVA